MKTVIRIAIRGYQIFISPVLHFVGGPGSGCRFEPRVRIIFCRQWSGMVSCAAAGWVSNGSAAVTLGVGADMIRCRTCHLESPQNVIARTVIRSTSLPPPPRSLRYRPVPPCDVRWPTEGGGIYRPQFHHFSITHFLSWIVKLGLSSPSVP